MNVPHYLRDCQGWSSSGLSLSTASNEAAKLLDAGLHQLIGWYEDENLGGLEGTCRKMLEVDENFVFGQIFANGIKLIGTADSARKDSKLNESLRNLFNQLKSNSHLTDLEKWHIKALKCFSDGFWQDAANVWEYILVEYPRDLLALKLAHDTYFYLGEQSQIRDSVLRILPHFRFSDPFYGYLKGMLSFGQVETNFYRQAEDSAKEALSINKHDAWATHSLAHVFEMEGRALEGSKFIDQNENNWRPCGLLACHLYWHRGLYAIDLGAYEEALSIYENQISHRCKSGSMLDIVDCASFLYRLKLEGVSSKNNFWWSEARELCQPHVDDQIMLFNDIHLMMAYFGDGRKDLVERLTANIDEFIKSNEATSYGQSSKVGRSIFSAFVAYEEKRYEEAADLLYRVRQKFVQIGGSNAQRDIFNLLLLQACIQSKSKHYIRLARNLLYERKAHRPESQLTDRLQQNILCNDDD